MIVGVSLSLVAAVLQGVFLLPMSRTRQWAWEHVWLVFSLTGMIVYNWVLTSLALPDARAFFAAVPRRENLNLARFVLALGSAGLRPRRAVDTPYLALPYPLVLPLT